MNSPVKFLLGIVAGITLLVIITVVLVVRRPEAAYQDDSIPEGAAHNYLLALQQKDYQRAFSYLPDAFIYPDDPTDMARDVAGNRWRFDLNDNASLAVESVESSGDRKALVTVRSTTFNNDGLFGSRQYSRSFTMWLVLESGAWKVAGAEDYWLNCWGPDASDACP